MEPQGEQKALGEPDTGQRQMLLAGASSLPALLSRAVSS